MQYSCPSCETDLLEINPGKPFWACPQCEHHWTTQDLESYYDNEPALKGNYAGWRQCMTEDIHRGTPGGGGGSSGRSRKKAPCRPSGPPEFRRLGEGCYNWEDAPQVKVTKEESTRVDLRVPEEIGVALRQIGESKGQPLAGVSRDILALMLFEKFSKAS